MKEKWHFLPASTAYYAGNSFADLLEEERKYDGYVYWHINGKNGVHKVKVNDVCLIYYSNLPDESSRILFIANVIESDYGKDCKSICPEASDGELYAKLKLKCISLEDANRFSLEELRTKYHLINERGQFSYLHVDCKKHQKLIEDIEKSLNEGTHGLKFVHDYFNDKYCMCEFGCKTFIEENGFYYIDKHHLVPRKLTRKYPEIGNVIEDKNNIFNLCPMCHKKIHHAQIDVKKDKIKTLYLKNKTYFDSNFSQLKGKLNTLEWLYSIYNCDK